LELNWSTFLLEILNFLILVWLLSRFLFRPVQEALARRKAQAEAIIANADAIRAEAEALRGRYESRLQDWEGEKQAARDALQQEVKEERERRLAALGEELEQSRRKDEAVAARQREDRLRRDQALCLEQGAQFASRLLSSFASPDLQTRLVDLALEQLQALAAPSAEALRLALATSREPVDVKSAFPLGPEQRGRLAATLGDLCGMTPDCRFSEEPVLLAGLRITVGPWVLHASLADELRAFAESAHDSA